MSNFALALDTNVVPLSWVLYVSYIIIVLHSFSDVNG